MKEITVEELKAKKDQNESFFLLDVREPVEYHVSNIEGELIPLGELPSRVAELNPHKDAEVIVMCRAGGRSAKAVEFLEAQGFSSISNLKGGMKAWAKEIDPSLPVG
ncbi:MAG: rhodanese-like domain-containing protein [Bacteroidota bacterium]